MATTGSRTLKLSILADVDQLKKSLADANKDVESSADKIAEFGKKAALAFAAAGAAVAAYAYSAVKAAAEDEKSRKSLEQTIRSSTQATEDQIAAIDTYITKQSIATATTDEVIRPALARLIRSTNDVTKAQELLDLAQNISAATGKDLSAVSNALGKAYDGSTGALGKLGLGIDAAVLKHGDLNQIVGTLKDTYGGFIANEGDNFEFKMKQITIALNETKEKIGYALLPIVKEFADYVLATVVPNIQAFAAGLTGDNSVTAGITDATQGAYNFGQQLVSVIGFVISMKDEIIILGTIIATVFVVNKIVAFVSAIGLLVDAFIALRNSAALAAVATAFATGGVSVAAGAAAVAAVGLGVGIAAAGSSGSSAAADMGTTTATAAQLATGAARAGTTVNNITVQAIDSESAARAVSKVLTQASARSIPALSGSSVRGN
jgi:hypothetical protein